MRISKSIITGILVLALLAFASLIISTGQPQTNDYKKLPCGEIDSTKLKTMIDKLSSVDFQGRGTGQMGIEKARDLIISEIKKIGLDPLPGDKTSHSHRYLQSVPLTSFDYDRESSSIDMSISADTNIILNFLKDFIPIPYSPIELDINGKLIFMSYGISAPEFGYDDYKNTDIKGKIVLVMDGEPKSDDPAIFDGRANTIHSNLRTKLELAINKGAAGFIIISSHQTPMGTIWSNKLRKENERKLPVITARSQYVPQIPAIVINDEKRDEIFSMAGRNYNELMSQIDTTLKPVQFDIGSISIKIKYKNIQEIQGQNILAYISGSDEKLKEEFVFMGAHYDHHGIMPDGTYYPGADDNASGVAGTLGALEILSKCTIKPKRSIAAAFWTAEEKGLLGSEYFANNPIVKLDKIVAYLNSDMIGRNHLDKPENSDFLMIFYSSQSPLIKTLLNNILPSSGLRAMIRSSDSMGGGGGGSDYYYFHANRIPSIFFFTGIHSDYENPTDTADKINIEKLTKISRLIASTALAIANLEEKPTFDPTIKGDPSQKTGRPF